MRRVVITGLGLLSPYGAGVEHGWNSLLSGRSAAQAITSFPVNDLPSQIAHLVPYGKNTLAGEFNPEDALDPKEIRKIAKFILYAIIAADEALKDSGWAPKTLRDQNATGVVIGSGIGGLEGIAENALLLNDRGPRRISPFFIPGNIINLASGHVAIRHHLKGPNQAVSTACSTGTHAISDATRMILSGEADVMVAGGAEAPVTRLGMAGFAACRTLSVKRNHEPHLASRPFDRDRDGFVMGEGAGILVLEELSHAKARGARIRAEIKGFGLSCDAVHITAPAPDGEGAFHCMTKALANAQLEPKDIDYINAHGTSTMADTIELLAVERLLGEAAASVSMSSTKSSIGHLLGAAGAVEAIFSLLAIRDNIAPANINLYNPERETLLDLVPLLPRKRRIDVVLSNSFGFGGTNASLIFQRYEA